MATLAVSLCGDIEPNHIRTATIDGVRGPVYYSVVDGTYHRIGHSDARSMPPGLQVADAASGQR
ncbi:hypothetical protein Sa4125_38360 [Aureimonas sp. SA4125]|nr:hypothetical protein Sa4125_38360 [Aureimonas sp. SA4125]